MATKTGNIAFLEVPFAILTIMCIQRQRFVVGGITLGMMSSLKLQPIVGVIAFLVLPIDWAQRTRAVAASLLTFAGIQLANGLVSGPYWHSFLKQLLGGIPGQQSAYGEEGKFDQSGFYRLRT